MTDRTHHLEQLVESIRSAELALEVARLRAAQADRADAEARLARLREQHARTSGWALEGAS